MNEFLSGLCIKSDFKVCVNFIRAFLKSCRQIWQPCLGKTPNEGREEVNKHSPDLIMSPTRLSLRHPQLSREDGGLRVPLLEDRLRRTLKKTLTKEVRENKLVSIGLRSTIRLLKQRRSSVVLVFIEADGAHMEVIRSLLVDLNSAVSLPGLEALVKENLGVSACVVGIVKSEGKCYGNDGVGEEELKELAAEVQAMRKTEEVKKPTVKIEQNKKLSESDGKVSVYSC